MEAVVPQHLAIIMDGNRRWARERGLPSFEGHRQGYETLKKVGEWCLGKGIRTLTVFAFSTENWKRAAEEVSFLMDLLEGALRNEKAYFLERGVRIKVVGRREGLRPSIQRAIEEIERETADKHQMTLAICLNYGGRTEIVDAARQLIQDGVRPEMVDEKSFASRLYWPDMPEPDVIVRTSGEERLSGFLSWQSAYSELIFLEKHWPAVEAADMDGVVAEYGRRQRRYGT